MTLKQNFDSYKHLQLCMQSTYHPLRAYTSILIQI